MDTVKVFDTWVEIKGKMLHFDVMTTNEATALKLANEYVASLGHQAVTVTAQECQFCHQEPLVMCCLEGKTHAEAGRILGWPTGTVAARISRGREQLRQRLQKRGIVVSSTMLTGMLTCPRQHYLNRQVRADPPRNANASLGSVIHVLAEHARNDELSLDELSDRLDEVWSELPFEASWLSEAERVKAEDALARFVNWQQTNSHADVVGVEVSFDVQLDVDGTPVQLVGTVDRLERTADGRLRVVDFKTNKRPITAAAAASHEQLGVYQLAIEAGGFDNVAGAGAHSAGGSLVFLRLAAGSDLDDYPREFHQASLREQPSLGEQDADHPTWVHERLSRAVGLVREGRYPATPGAGCQWCPFQSSCPAKPSGRQVVA